MILPDTSVELEVVVATRTYRIVRDARGIRVTDPKDWVASEQLDVRSLLNPRILSQRQIADIAGNREAQLLELDATIPESIRAFTIEAGTLVSEFERRQVELRRLRAQQALIPAVETEFRTVSDKISFLEQGESQDLLQRMAALQAEQRWLDVALRALVDRRSALDEESTAASAADASLSSPPPASPTAAWLREVELRVRQQLQESAELSRVRSNGLAATKEAIEAERQQIWEPAYREASEAFAALETEARERGVRFSEHRSLIARRLELETQLAPLRDAADRISSAAQRVEQAWRNLRDLHLRRAEERRRAADALRERVDDIRLDLAVFGDSSGLLRRREEWFGGTGLQERDWEQIVDYVYEAPDGIADRWHAVVTAMAEDVDATSALGRPLEPRESRVKTVIGLKRPLTRHFFNALGRVDRERIDAAARYLMNDAIETKVRDASGEFKPIGQGSLGQQATGVLSLVLSSGDQPLIVDQPEEDLDNSYIYDVVVELIRDRKFTRQLIFATHNPNIPVNGDAEQIIAFAVDNRLGVVASAGSIDMDQVKDSVSRVLEGSTEAFQLRAERYGF